MGLIPDSAKRSFKRGQAYAKKGLLGSVQEDFRKADELGGTKGISPNGT